MFLFRQVWFIMTSGVSDAKLLETFREIGEASIQSIILTYFKTELKNSSLDMTSRVFPVPLNSEVVFLNQLAVRTCLYNNWSGIQDSYPCLHDFEYVVGDADFLYTMKYPYINMTTMEAHVIETVHDFVDFVFEFIQSLCMPCIQQSDKSCVVMRRKMKEALEKCKTHGGCSETRRNLLNFVTHNLALPDPNSAMNMTANVNWNHQNTMANTVIEYNKTLPSQVAAGVSIELNKHTPESPLYADAVKTLEILVSNGSEIQKSTAMYYIHGVLKMNRDVIYQMKENVETGEWYLVDVFFRNEKIEPIAEQVEDFNRLINEVLSSIVKDKDLIVLEKLVRYQQKTEIPLDFAVKGSYDEKGGWHTKSMIYVVAGNMYLQNTQMQDMHSSSATKTTMLVEKNVDEDMSYVHMPRWVDQTDGENPHEERRRTERLQGQKLDLTSNSEEAAIENARILNLALYGDVDDDQRKENFIDQDEYVATIIFLDQETVKKHPEQLTDMIDVVTKHNYYRGELAKIRNDCELQRNLDQARRFKEMTNDIAAVATQACTTTEADSTLVPHNTPISVEEKLKLSVAKYIASFTPVKLDYRLKQDVRGWSLFTEYRDAVENARKDGKEPSAEDFVKKTKAERAYKLAKLFRKQNSSPLWWWGKLMRKQHHHLMQHCVIGAPSACWNYMNMQLKLDGGRDSELFEANFYKLVYSKLIDEVADENYADLNNFAEDIMFAMHHITPRWEFPFFMRPSELEFFGEATGFLSFYAATWICRVVGERQFPLSVNDAGKLDFPENEGHRETIFWGHQVVMAAGAAFGTRIDLTLFHYSLLIGLYFSLYMIGDLCQKGVKKLKKKPDAPKINPASQNARDQANRARNALRGLRGLGGPSVTRGGTAFSQK